MSEFEKLNTFTEAICDWVLHYSEHGEHSRGLVIFEHASACLRYFRKTETIFEGFGVDSKKLEISHPNGSVLKFVTVFDLEDAWKYAAMEFTWMCAIKYEDRCLRDPIAHIRGCLRSAHGIPPQFITTRGLEELAE